MLRLVHEALGAERSVGFDVARHAIDMARERATDALEYRCEDAAASPECFDLMLFIDVVEHVEDPIGFLRALRPKAEWTVLHIPLDLSVQSVLRPGRLLHARRRVGHLHYFAAGARPWPPSRTLATRCGRRVSRPRMPELPMPSLKARAVRLPRRYLPPAFAARTLGGFSLMILAENDPA